jgi:hypothetical protein
MSKIDRPLHILLHYLAVMNGCRIGHCDTMAIFRRLSEQVPDLSHDELISAADRAKAIGRDLRGLAWRIEQAARRGEARKRAP